MQLNITTARLNAIADDRFEDVLARKIASIVRGRDDHAYLDHLAPGLQMIYTTRHIENEVRRDGFEAYLSRGGGHLAAKAMQGYELVGAECHAALVENAACDVSATRHIPPSPMPSWTTCSGISIRRAR